MFQKENKKITVVWTICWFFCSLTVFTAEGNGLFAFLAVFVCGWFFYGWIIACIANATRRRKNQKKVKPATITPSAPPAPKIITQPIVGNCPHCGAPVRQGTTNCEYCDSLLKVAVIS